MSIQVENLNHTYNKGQPDSQKALRDVSFDVKDREILGIIGHTGSGKSTLLQHLNGLLKPDDGTIIIDGVNITGPGVKLSEIRKRVGLVFQYPEYQLFEETVAKDVGFGPRNLGMKDPEVEESVKQAIEMVGLNYDDIKDRSPFELSGGQKRRVAIAGVIAMKPDVLILDEPTSGLDPGAHADILEMIHRIHRDFTNIIILVSHNMEDVAQMSKRVMVMEAGTVVTVGTPKEVFANREMLHRIGLSAPPAAVLLDKLAERGLHFNKEAISMGQVEEELYGFLKDHLVEVKHD